MVSRSHDYFGGIRVGQINVMGSSICLEELNFVIRDRRIDIVLLQEPYSCGGRVPHLDGYRVYYASEKPKAAIVIANNGIEGLFVRELSDEHHVCVKCIVGDRETYVMSSYFQYRDEIDRHIKVWDRCLRSLHGKRVVLAGDVNAKSEMWFDQVTDSKGESLEAFIVANDLEVCNKPGELSTFAGVPGAIAETNIDVTLRTRSVRVDEWEVVNEGNSDHRLILFTLQGMHMNERADISKRGRFVLENADWNLFTSSLENRMEQPSAANGSLESVVVDLTTTLVVAAEEAIPRARVKRPTVKWWNRDLELERTRVRRLRMKINVPGTDEECKQRKCRYRMARNAYFAKVRQEKKSAWERFVTTEGNRDPWGIPYKVIRGQSKKELLISTMKIDDDYVHDIDMLAEKLLDSLLPSDPGGYNDDERMVIDRAEGLTAEMGSREISVEELKWALFSMGRKKAPGFDDLTVDIFCKAWGKIKDRMLNVMNTALQEEKFPSLWKIRIVKVLYKGLGKDPQVPKSYRPLTLLPVMGKVYEKILNRRLLEVLEGQNKLHEHQYGFRAGKGTEDAIVQVLNVVRNSEKKYALGVFLDIAGAFDNAWWPRILVQLQDFGVTGKELAVVKDYFKDRYAILSFRGVEVEKRLTMGCRPQGSVLGPTLWLVLFDAFLRLQLPVGCRTFAYADDGLLLVEANSRSELERKAHDSCEMISRWSRENRLRISVEKTKMMLLKGRLSRKPIVKLGGDFIEYVGQHMYLGVLLDEKQSFRQHLVQAANKATAIFYKTRRLARANWGFGAKALTTLYRCVGESILLYGAAVWAHRMSLSTYADVILRAQRLMLLTVSKGYRTASREALQVLTGVLPIDLKAMERRDMFSSRRMGRNRDREIKDFYMDEWQRRWDGAENGRVLYMKMPDVRDRCRRKLEIGHYGTQFLTGHGNFRSYLNRFGLCVTDKCKWCGVADTPEHVLYDCWKYVDQRVEMVRELSELGVRFDITEICRVDEAMVVFDGVVTKIGKSREEENIHEV